MDAQADGGGLTLSRFAAAAWRRAWIVVLATGAAALAGHAVALDHPRVHEAKALLLVGPLKAGIDTLARVRPAGGDLRRARPEPPGARRDAIAGCPQRSAGGTSTMSANQTTRLLTVEARDPDPACRARLANAHAASLVALAARRASAGVPIRQAAGRRPRGARPVGGRARPDDAHDPRRTPRLGRRARAVALAESSRTTIRDRASWRSVTGVPCLASVGRAAPRRRRTPIVQRRAHSRAADEYRLLAAKLDALGARSLAVVSVDGAQAASSRPTSWARSRARGACGRRGRPR